MGKVVLLCLFAAITISFARRQPFQSLKAPTETIENYHVVTPTITYRSGPEAYPLELWVEISTDSTSYTLQLELNEVLLPSHFTSSYFDSEGNKITEEGHVSNCFYQGKVVDHPEWMVVMSMCHGLQGSFGRSSDKTQYFHLEPLSNADTSLTQPHALYLASEFKEQERTCGTSHGHSPDRMPPSSLQLDNTKKTLRRRLVNGFYLVEWLVVNDNRQFQAYGSNLTAVVLRALEVANYIDMLYRDLSIRVVLVHTETWTDFDRFTVVSDPNQLLDDFSLYRSRNIDVPHDSTMLLTGIDINGGTVGIAFIGTMCSENLAVGVTQDFGTIEATGATAAHEMGHIFNMEHDDNRGCTCTDPAGDCIMSAVSGFPSPSEWSSCSRSDLQDGFNDRNLGRCLDNEPTTTVGDPVCGNGIRERDEVCDCGSQQECQDPCCNATSCQLMDGAQCFSGPCCQSNCQFVGYGTTCREQTNECDILEYCSGESSECPRETFLQDGFPCNDNQSYCYSGACRTYEAQCQLYWGSEPGVENCYNGNRDGDQFGHCGYTTTAFIPCSESNIMCGQLHCTDGDFVNPNPGFFITRLTSSVFQDGITHTCRSFTTQPGADVSSPGLVQDGTRCGPEMLCFEQECISVTVLANLIGLEPCNFGSNGLTCSGNGQCNNNHECSCNVGHAGDACELVYTGPGGQSGGGGGGGGNDDAGSIAGIVIGVILGLAISAGVTVLIVFLVWRSRNSRSYPPRATYTKPAGSTTGDRKEALIDHPAVHVTARPSAPPPPAPFMSYNPPAYTPSYPQPQRPKPPGSVQSHPSRPPRPTPVQHVAQPSSRPPPPRPTPIQHAAQPSSRPPPPSRKPPPQPQTTKPSAAPRPTPAPKPTKMQVQWPPPAATGDGGVSAGKKPIVPPRK